ncbi:MAG: glycosyltransferase [Desulfosoma sp.]|uniref:glycosyltransferase n=1 Tax=Desulfosoma sp. TaxID=2603217 RepID=UPI0040495F80
MNIYYMCLSNSNHPVGGVRVMYRHVDILNEAGVEAYIVHAKDGFRCTWFENSTPIVYWRENMVDRAVEKVMKRMRPRSVQRIRLRGGRRHRILEGDVIAIPEIFGPGIASFARGVRKVILNQNGYLTFRGYNFRPDAVANPYVHPEVAGVMVNSLDGEAYLRHAFPAAKIVRFKLSVDKNVFSYQEKKKKQITFSLIKNLSDALQVINILRCRGVLQGWNVLPFINRPQREVAQIMRDSLVFLSFGYPEGFGLPAAEAMACGCLVIGYHGGGGREFFKPEFSYPIEAGDIVGFARTVEKVLQSYEDQRLRFDAMRRAAAEFIRATYSAEEERKSVLEAWKALVGVPVML